MKKFCCYLMVLIGLVFTGSAQVIPFDFNGQRVMPGTKTSFFITVPAGGDSVQLPFTVIHGKKTGPVIGLMAGVHGYEYPPILALQALPGYIDPALLTGTVVILHLANVPAFLGRSVYYNPIDGKNLNRSFPGHKTGTITDKIAWFIAHDYFRYCNYLIDVHGGDASEDLHPYVGYYRNGPAADLSQQLAVVSGYDWLIAADLPPKAGEATLYAGREAAMQGIPSITIEHGKLGIPDKAVAEVIQQRLLNMMRYLKLLPGEVVAANQPMTITGRASIKSEDSGIIKTDKKSGDLVRKGMKLAAITDLTGKHLRDITAPVDGVIIYMLATPPVNKGETLFSFGILP
ncbi:succinylglutamate desuccinylase/aspartoacylase family protein [Chitinophaga nivalis]|uniref:M14 family metallopeptidase n=1 Tax=Chitinophaga nivalis TaxID=2991709 RepID=A0ABT3IJW8_9BACT|nr:M14 family metallopeptidase [Chitinophaga nivalis]MCW3466047.1 M14 family metallopeptidase [Chitinophaga nivalis]MCW3484262.1 M14 family metallopeptidase [Chitinophaga nivalis]